MVSSPIQIDSSQAAKGVVMESETAAATVFSFFGADRMIVWPGSERAGPVLSSVTGLQSNQMFISHSNQMGIHKSSVVPIHPTQLSGDIYDMGSTQYNNMNFSANADDPGAKTAVPSKRPVPVSLDKRCRTQYSLHSPGRNGEAISYSWNNSTSDETEDRQVIDVRKKRKMLSNRESARRSRLRKQLHFDALRAQVAHLRAENGQILNKFNIAAQHYAQITEENSQLTSHALELIQKLQRLHHTINAQSHRAFKTMGIETGICSGAHLSTESDTIAQCFIEASDLLS